MPVMLREATAEATPTQRYKERQHLRFLYNKARWKGPKGEMI